MVVGGRAPTRGSMAGTAISTAKLTFMRIVLLVAGNTSPGGTEVDVIYMTGCASNIDMFIHQFITGQVVVHACRSPAARSMTGRAIGTETTLVRVLNGVAGFTILWSRPKICNGTGVWMTLTANQLGVFSYQFEGDPIVIKFMTVTVHAIVTGQAGTSKILNV